MKMLINSIYEYIRGQRENWRLLFYQADFVLSRYGSSGVKERARVIPNREVTI